MKRLLVLLLLIFPVSIIQAQELNPAQSITYIGRDGNVYLTDGTQTLPLTANAAGNDPGQFPRYQQPRLSPDGTQVAVVREDTIRRAILLLTPGGEPVELWQSEQYFSLNAPVMAWSPDGTQLAFFAYNETGSGVFTLRVSDGSVRFVTSTGGGCIGEAGGEDPARLLATYESGNSPYSETYALAWSQGGILFAPVENCGGAGLTTPEGEMRRSHSTLFDPVFASDIPLIAAGAYEFDDLIGTILLPDGEAVMLELPEDAKLLAWSGENWLYRTRELISTVSTNPEMAAGFDIYPGYWYGFTAENYTLTLWEHHPGAEDRKLFETEGYDFGTVSPAASGLLLISIITSNVDAVTALNNGASADKVRDLPAHAVTYLVENGEIILTIEGGQPDFNGATFSIQP